MVKDTVSAMEIGRKYKKKIIIADEKSTPKARGFRLKRLRSLADLSRAELCTLGKININTLKGWEIGKYGGLPLDMAEKIIQVISSVRGVQCTLDWLIYEVGVGPSVSTDFWKINEEKKDCLQNDDGKNCALDEEVGLILNEIILFRKQFRNTIDFLINDDGMQPLYNSGEYVAGIKRYKENIEYLVGENCIVQLASGEIMVRNLRMGSEIGKYSLFCINPQTKIKDLVIHNVELASAAPVIRHFRCNPLSLKKNK